MPPPVLINCRKFNEEEGEKKSKWHHCWHDKHDFFFSFFTINRIDSTSNTFSVRCHQNPMNKFPVTDSNIIIAKQMKLDPWYPFPWYYDYSVTGVIYSRLRFYHESYHNDFFGGLRYEYTLSISPLNLSFIGPLTMEIYDQTLITGNTHRLILILSPYMI